MFASSVGRAPVGVFILPFCATSHTLGRQSWHTVYIKRRRRGSLKKQQPQTKAAASCATAVMGTKILSHASWQHLNQPKAKGKNHFPKPCERRLRVFGVPVDTNGPKTLRKRSHKALQTKGSTAKSLRERRTLENSRSKKPRGPSKGLVPYGRLLTIVAIRFPSFEPPGFWNPVG